MRGAQQHAGDDPSRSPPAHPVDEVQLRAAGRHRVVQHVCDSTRRGSHGVTVSAVVGLELRGVGRGGKDGMGRNLTGGGCTPGRGASI